MKKLALLVLLLASVNSLFGQVVSGGGTSMGGTVNYGENVAPPTNGGFYGGNFGDEYIIVNDNNFYTNKIIDVCNTLSQDPTLKADVATEYDGYEWLICEATIDHKEGVNSTYEWGGWRVVKTTSSLSEYDVVYDDIFSSSDVQRVAYYCRPYEYEIKFVGSSPFSTKVYKQASSYIVFVREQGVDITGVSSIAPKYVCPDQEITVSVDAFVSGSDVELYWYKKEGNRYTEIKECKPNSFMYNESLTFSLDGYFDNNSLDYYLATKNSCGTTTFSKGLKTVLTSVQYAKEESYNVPAILTKTACVNDRIDLNLEIANFKNDYTYEHYWEYKSEGDKEWTKITSDEDGVHSNNTSTTLEITPNDASEFNNRKYHCVLIGVCGNDIESPEFTLKIQQPAKLEVDGITPSVATACVGEPVTYTANIVNSDYDGTVKYQWRVNDRIEAEFSTTKTFTHTTGTSADAIKCEVINSDACKNKAADFTTEIINVYKKPVVSINSTATGCGASTANLTAKVTEGKLPYTYEWGSGEDTETITNKVANIEYTVTVNDDCANDGYGSGVTESVTPTSEPPLTLTIADSSNVLCNAQQNGSINVEISGGVTPYNFTILKDGLPFVSNNKANANYENKALYAGSYTVEVTDACLGELNGSTKQTKKVTITQPDELKTIISDYSNITCNQGGNGNATVKISGGTEPYNVRWSNGQNKENAVKLFAGLHICNVNDNNGCHSESQVELTQPEPLSATITTTDVSCNGDATGTITVTAEGGSGNYSYSWDYDDELSSNAVTDLAAGTYEVTITDDDCGTSITKTVTINEPDALTVEPVITNVSCFGQSDGIVELVATNGVGEYTYSWVGSKSTTSKATGLAVSTLEYTVTDECDDVASGTVSVTQPEALTIETPIVTNASCNGKGDGAIEVTATGGTAPYVYNWAGGIQSNNLKGLFAGTYQLNVLDVNACLQTLEVEVTEPSALSAIVTKTDVKCNGEATGEIDVTAEGGSGNYKYSWDYNDKLSSNAATGLEAGTYEVTISDDNCKIGITKTVTVTEPAVLEARAEITHVSCNGQSDGVVEIVATNGVGKYTYTWADAANKTSKTTGLKETTLEYTVTDECNDVASGTAVVTQPDAITITETVTNATCNGNGDGTITVEANGGTAPYVYNWEGGMQSDKLKGLFAGTYHLNVLDVNACLQSLKVEVTEPSALSATITKEDVGCNGDATGAITVEAVEGGSGNYTYAWDYDSELSSNAATGLSAGTYEVTIKDESCETGITKSVTVNEPAVLEAKAEITHVSCFGFSDGEVEIVATNGVGEYTYTWVGSTSTTSKATGLDVSTLEYTVTDECNDVVSGTAIVTEPKGITIETPIVTNASCNGKGDGSIEVTATGGTAPYVYNWAGGIQSDELTGLFAGTYQLNVLDANACLQTLEVEVTEPSVLSAEINTTNVKCNGEATGEIEVTAEGGSGNYTYTWAKSGLSGNAVTALEAGIYEVTISDDKCSTSVVETVTVTEPSALEYELIGTDITCSGDANGQAEVKTTGGVGTTSVLWNTTATTRKIQNLDSAYYSVTIKDACVTIKDSVRINEPAALKVEIESSNISCYGLVDGKAEAIVTGGTAPYSYNWSNSQTTTIANRLNKGKHSVNVTDANSCMQIQTVEITQPKPLSAMIEGDDFICFGKSTADIFVSTDGGVAPYTYKWSDKSFAANDTVKNVKAGDYTVTITDACKAEIEKSVTISQHAKLTAEPVITDVSCFGQSDGAVELVATKGVSPYKYIWENAANTSAKTTGLKADTLSYKVTDACKDTISGKAIVLQPDAMKIDTLIKHVSCNGDGDGSIEVSAKGGAAPYVYNWSGGIQSNKMQGLFAGTYKLTVLDVNACFQSLEIEVNEPAELEILSDIVAPECNSSNGSIDLTILGGTAPYTYKWFNDTVVMNNTADSLIDIVSGDYSVVVTDKNGCKQDAEFKVSTYVPGYEICMLTVDRDHGKNKIVWEKTHNTPITNVNVYSYYGGVYDYIGSTDSVEESYYDDMFSEPDAKMARYAITTEDACGNESELSPFHQTMHLAAVKDVDGKKVNLIWTEYIDESGMFKPKWYYLYKGTSSDNLVLFDSVGVGTQGSDENPQGATIYRVAVKKENPCITKGILKAESGPFTLAVSNIAESEQLMTGLTGTDLDLQVYPNPSEGEFSVEGNFDDSYTYSVYTMNGTEIATGFADSHGFVIDITNQPLGIYTLSITNGEETAVVNLVVQK